MSKLNGRIERLEQLVPTSGRRTCASRPTFTLGGESAPCPECGRAPLVFTIAIDRTDLPDDAA